MHQVKMSLCATLSMLSICQLSIVTATKSSLIRSNRVLADGSVSFDPINVLGGPYPHGWVNSTNVDDQANLAFDLGAMYEEEETSKKKALYTDGIRTSQVVTLKSLGEEALIYSGQAPLYNYYTYALREIGKLEGESGGTFDGQLAENYADTIVDDLFGVELITSPVPGIEKEAVLITGLWMRCYNYIHEIVRLCRDEGSSVNTETLIENLDKSVALWIGRMQVHGDNARGTMLYNLAERAGVNFAQDHGEVPVNRKLMDSWQTMKDKIDEGVCAQTSDDAYKVLYDEMNNVIRQMNIPLIQNFIHYITTGAERKIIELYALVIYPQIISCDNSYVDLTFDELSKLAKPQDEIDLMSTISKIREMYSCLGVTCNDIGSHSSGSSCVDEDVDPIKSIAGYKPNSDVRGLVKIDRDMNQIYLLLREGNVKSAFDLYKFGKNVKAVDDDTGSNEDDSTSLRSMALHRGLDDNSGDTKRLHKMYEEYFYGSNFADDLVTAQFQGGDFPAQTVPDMIQTIVAPQYAIRSFFAAYDLCESDNARAEALWDQGVAVVVGSIEGESALGNENNNGLSWFALGDELCRIFHCGDGDFENPSYRKKMMDNIKFGRDYIRSGRCKAVHNKVIAMESLLIIPMLQGILYHTRELSIDRKAERYAHVIAFGLAVLPFLEVESKEDASIIQQALTDQDFEFDGSHTEKIWTAVTLSISGLGINCTDIGIDTFGVLQKDASFCDLTSSVTQFPSFAPQPTVSPQPTKGVQTPSPSSFPTPSENIKMNEINPAFREFFREDKIEDATATAQIALDVKDIATSRNDVGRAKSVYTSVSNSYVSLQGIAEMDPNIQVTNPLYNFYRHAFRESDLFNYSTETIDNFPNTVVMDAFDFANDIDLASEAIVVMIIFMKISHDLSSAITKCKEAKPDEATDYIETAFALYVGVGQSEGGSDGHLFYSFAERVATNYMTLNDSSNEALVNTKIRALFGEARDITMDTENVCDASNYVSLRRKVGSILSMMNLSLVRQFLFLLEQNAHATEQTNYLELFGLAVLPQIETCQPTNYHYLTKEITDNGLNLDPALTLALVKAFKKSFHCFGLTCEDIYGVDNRSCLGLEESSTYAGFSTESVVTTDAQLDIDVLKISTLVKEGAIQEALEFYEFGDIIDITSSSSLRQLVIEQGNVTNEMFTKYFDHSDDVHDLIVNAINGNQPFDEFNIHERSEAVVKTFQTMLFVQASMSSLFEAAYDDCTTGSFEHWDRATAYLIGSIEGKDFGGDFGNNGVSIFGLAKNMCDSFDVCTESNDAEVNKHLLATMSRGQDLISAESCPELQNYVEKRIMPLILVPLIQATIFYADQNKPALFYIMGHAIYPFVYEVNSQAAVTIRQGSDINNVRIDGMSTMVAFNETLSGLSVDCSDVGYSAELGKGMCDVIDSKQEQSYSLSDGLYVTTTFVESSAKIAEDVEFIEAALKRGDIDQAKGYYRDGLFSNVYDESGRKIGLQSIRDFSVRDSTYMLSEPIFNLYQYALKDVEEFSGNPHEYADRITMSFFNQDDIFVSSETKSNDKTLAIEAGIALNLWGTIVHLLYDTIKKCEKDELNSDSEGIHNIDKAVAYWIGSKQVTGDHTKGFLLYKLTEAAAEIFSTEFHDRQAKANRNILRLFKEAALQLSSQGACYSGNTVVTTQLRYIADKLVSQMTIPLIQHLIHNLMQNDQGRVIIYSHAVVPLIAPCDKSTYEYLHKKLISDSYKRSEVDDIIRALQSTYSCLDLKCSDIGHFEGVPECTNRGELQQFSGYRPLTDVREFLDIDLDIRFIEIMLEQEAFDAAKDIYFHGKHAVVMSDDQKEPLSLRTLATSNKRRQYIPTFPQFSEYFGGNDNYADGEIVKLFDEFSSFLGSPEQYRAIIVKTLQYQVTFMAALQRIYQAIEYCKSSTQAQSLQALATWDVAAALLIGSMKKTKEFLETSQNDGYMLFGLGEDLCDEFNTCYQGSAAAKSNLKILDSLYSGSFELEQRSCHSVSTVAHRIESQLLVSLIQGTLHCAYMNKQPDFDRERDESFAAGYIYSRSILPYIQQKDPKSGEIISKNMNFQFVQEAVVDGYKAVFDSVAGALDKLDLEITCEDIGFMKEANRGVCSGKTPSSSSRRMKASASIAMLLVPLFVF